MKTRGSWNPKLRIISSACAIISLTLERFMLCPYSYFQTDSRRLDTTPAPALFHFFMCFGRTIVERPKPFIQRNHSVGVINFEIFVMEIMCVIRPINRCFLASHNPVESRMSLRRSNPKPRQEIDHMHGVCRYDKEYQDRRKILIVIIRIELMLIRMIILNPQQEHTARNYIL